MSLARDVADVIDSMERGTIDDVLPHFPNHTRKQLMKALENAKWHGMIDSTGNRPLSVHKLRPGSLCAIYFRIGGSAGDYMPPDADDSWMWVPNLRRPASDMAYPSVFHYAEGRGVRLTWSANDNARRTA